MLRKIEDFQKDWKYEQDATLKVLNALTDASLSQKVSPGGRELGFLAWHLVLTLGEMPKHVGLVVDAPAPDAPAPTSAAEITAAYEKAATSLAGGVAKWNDETLLQEDQLYGETWNRGTTLFNMIAHQIHHRGQMTVLMRARPALPSPASTAPQKKNGPPSAPRLCLSRNESL